MEERDELSNIRRRKKELLDDIEVSTPIERPSNKGRNALLRLYNIIVIVMSFSCFILAAAEV